MPKLVPIVEGDGEVAAVPNLITRILHAQNQFHFHVDIPINANGGTNITKQGGLERFVQLARMRPDCKAVLILMDADEQCPVTLALHLAARLSKIHITCPIGIVLAKCEYEAWFLATIETIAASYEALPAGIVYPGDVEAKRGVKEWLGSQFMGTRIYKEAIDQALMTRLIDLDRAASRSRSFRRLLHAVEELVSRS